MPHQSNNSKGVAWFLFAAAAIQALLGFVGWSMQGRAFNFPDWIFTASGMGLLLLSVRARTHPSKAAGTALGFYLLLLAMQAGQSVAKLQSGLVFKIPVVILLLLACCCCRRSGKAPG